jgi:putative hydrolase of the HAD superfamily
MTLVHIGAIFDGDDTLWETQAIYVCTKNLFLKEIGRLGFNSQEAEGILERIDVHNVRLMGFSRLRFPKSMSDTYQAFCLLHHKTIDEPIRKHFERIGYSAFEKKPKIFEGVIKVLEMLRRQNLKLILATKGDQEIQEKKIHDSGLSSYFHHVYSLAEKGGRELQKIVQECNIDPRESWAIGNSMKSDINPALRIGLKAIWIENITWDFEKEEPVDEQRLFKFSSIKELPGFWRLN